MQADLLTPRSRMFTDMDVEVIVKVISTSSAEYRIAQRLLGERSWPAKSRPVVGAGSPVERLWETLHFVPLAKGIDGLVPVQGHPEVAALVMKWLVPLTMLGAWVHGDVLVLVHAVVQAAQVGAALAAVRCCIARALFKSPNLAWIVTGRICSSGDARERFTATSSRTTSSLICLRWGLTRQVTSYRFTFWTARASRGRRSHWWRSRTAAPWV
jgi:hypothetical protein